MTCDPEPEYLCHPEMTAAALRQGLFKQGLRYWMCLTKLPIQSVPQMQQIRAVAWNMQDFFGVERRQAYRVLSSGNGVFWDYTKGTHAGQRGRIALRAKEAVAAALGLASPGPSERRPFGEILGQDSAYYAYLAVREHYRCQGQPDTVKALADATGISIRSQRAYIARESVDAGTALQLVSMLEPDGAGDEILRSSGLNDPELYVGEHVIFRNGMFCAVRGIYRRLHSHPSPGGTVATDAPIVHLGYSAGRAVFAEQSVARRTSEQYSFPEGIP